MICLVVSRIQLNRSSKCHERSLKTLPPGGEYVPGDVPGRGNVRLPSVILSDLCCLGSDLNAVTAEDAVFQSGGLKAEESSVARKFGFFASKFRVLVTSRAKCGSQNRYFCINRFNFIIFLYCDKFATMGYTNQLIVVHLK